MLNSPLDCFPDSLCQGGLKPICVLWVGETTRSPGQLLRFSSCNFFLSFLCSQSPPNQQKAYGEKCYRICVLLTGLLLWDLVSSDACFFVFVVPLNKMVNILQLSCFSQQDGWAEVANLPLLKKTALHILIFEVCFSFHYFSPLVSYLVFCQSVSLVS